MSGQQKPHTSGLVTVQLEDGSSVSYRPLMIRMKDSDRVSDTKSREIAQRFQDLKKELEKRLAVQ